MTEFVYVLGCDAPEGYRTYVGWTLDLERRLTTTRCAAIRETTVAPDEKHRRHLPDDGTINDADPVEQNFG